MLEAAGFEVHFVLQDWAAVEGRFPDADGLTALFLLRAGAELLGFRS